MYEVEDYEDQIAKHRKRLWNWTILLCVGFIFCGAFACADARSTDGESMRLKWSTLFGSPTPEV